MQEFGVRELAGREIDVVSGGVDWEVVGGGLLAVSTAAFALAAAPETGGASIAIWAGIMSAGGHVALAGALM